MSNFSWTALDGLDGEVAPAGFWHGPWDPEIQADWVEQFYTIAVSKSQVGCRALPASTSQK